MRVTYKPGRVLCFVVNLSINNIRATNNSNDLNVNTDQRASNNDFYEPASDSAKTGGRYPGASNQGPRFLTYLTSV